MTAAPGGLSTLGVSSWAPGSRASSINTHDSGGPLSISDSLRWARSIIFFFGRAVWHVGS